MARILDKTKRTHSFQQLQKFINTFSKKSLFDVLVLDINSNEHDYYDSINISFIQENYNQEEKKYVIAIHFNDSLEEHCIPLTDLPQQIMSCYSLCSIMDEWLSIASSWHRFLKIYIWEHDESGSHKQEILRLIR